MHHRTIQINHQPDASFPVYYPDVYLQLSMFRALSRPSSEVQWLQWQPLVLPLYRGDSHCHSDCHHDTKVKPEAATAVIELLMMGGTTPETSWDVNKHQDNKLENCCIWLVIYFNHNFTIFLNRDKVVFMYVIKAYGRVELEPPLILNFTLWVVLFCLPMPEMELQFPWPPSNYNNWAVNILPLPGIELRFLWLPARNLVIMPTELSRLSHSGFQNNALPLGPFVAHYVLFPCSYFRCAEYPNLSPPLLVQAVPVN